MGNITNRKRNQMNHYDRALIAYYEQQGADKDQIEHIKGNQKNWK